MSSGLKISTLIRGNKYKYANRIALRNYSLKSRASSMIASYNRIGDENSKESQTTLKIIRRIGAVSVITVLCLLFWASSMVEPTYEKVEVTDLKKDVRE